mgnify:CR=1 FL=1
MKNNYLISGIIAPLLTLSMVMFGAFAPSSAMAAGDNPDYTYSYEKPVLREDGSALASEDISGYRIYIYKDNSADPYQVLDVEGADTLTKIYEFTEAGKYLSTISTVTTDDQEGAKSQAIITLVELPSIGLPKPPSFGGQDWSCSATCNFEIK